MFLQNRVRGWDAAVQDVKIRMSCTNTRLARYSNKEYSNIKLLLKLQCKLPASSQQTQRDGFKRIVSEVPSGGQTVKFALKSLYNLYGRVIQYNVCIIGVVFCLPTLLLRHLNHIGVSQQLERSTHVVSIMQCRITL